MQERTIATGTVGRYLVAQPAIGGPLPLLVGFHGYAESAEIQLDRLQRIPGADKWLLVSVQALNNFYRGRSQEVVASWMTRQHRDLSIAHNIVYVSSIVDAVARERPLGPALVFAGFSQGVAMAFRAAVASGRPVNGVIAVGGDVPPELDVTGLRKVRAVLVGRGQRDEWYTGEKLANDVGRLEEARVDVRAIEFDGGHEWPDRFASHASSFLETLNAR